VLEAVKQAAPQCRIYFAGSSEMFGNAPVSPQTEETKFSPRSPYGISKVTGYDLARNYREAYGMFVCSGILFNHESPRRGFEFVTRKISSHVAQIKRGLIDTLPLGNLDAKRDWGFAGDYVIAMWMMLQQPRSRDYVIATGQSHSVREFCEVAFACVGLDWQKHVVVDPNFYRPAEIHQLVGDASLARRELGWSPSMPFADLVRTMVEHDLQLP
jgi:GDPmannose 4,6-dehydratase